MSHIEVSPLLKFALRLDGAASLAMGVMTCAWSDGVAALLGTAALPVLATGIFLLAYGLAVGWLGTRRQLPRWAVWAVVVGNVVWVIDSIVLTRTGWIAPGTLGLVLLLGQAAAVALFAELQYMGMKRSAVAQPA